MTSKATLRELVAKEQIFTPCIWDCRTARVAEVTGYKAALLSGGQLAESVCGLPDIGLMTADDLVQATERICNYSPLPIIIDADDGYGETPLNAYRTILRIARAGAMALTLDDTTGFRGYNRWGAQFSSGCKDGEIDHPVMPMKDWLAKIKASLAACEGTDCMVIARTESKLKYGLDEAMERCVRARELGAEMTLIIGLKTIEEGRTVARHDPGWKMWPDVSSRHGIPDVRLEDIEPLGFNLVTMHTLEKGAMYGMIDFSKHVIRERNTVYVDQHDMGMTAEERKQCMDMAVDWWLVREKEFKKLK
jgi:2-methylisocitrate lyase-like PEP mutase family enzyme